MLEETRGCESCDCDWGKGFENLGLRLSRSIAAGASRRKQNAEQVGNGGSEGGGGGGEILMSSSCRLISG